MDLSLIKSKLNGFSKSQTGEKIDYKKVYFKPKPGEYSIRILPSAYDKANPFKEVFVYYGLTKFPMFSLVNWKEPDPIIQFIEKLKKTNASKEEAFENWKLAKKLEPKMRIFVPVVIRGQEQDGARLWEFGTEVYKQLLALADDEDYGDYTSITEGRDFKIKVEESLVGKRKVNKVVSINIRPKQSPITEDANLLKELLENQPDILKVNKKNTYEAIKEALISYLNGDEEEAATAATEEEAIATNDDVDIDVINTKEPESDGPEDIVKESNLTKFDKLFNK